MRRLRLRATALASALLAALAVLGYGAWWPASTLFGPVTVHGDRGVPRVALTFDDGPDPEVTPRVLDVLRARGVHATFFVLGERAAAHPDLVARLHEEGHQIGNHSWAHHALILRSEAAIRADLERTQEAVRAVVGGAPRVFRPPYGLRDPRVLRTASALGLRTVLWSASPRDWTDPEPATIVSRTLQSVGPGDIVLLHDGAAGQAGGRPRTAEALGALIDGLRQRGFEAVRLDELLAPARGGRPAGSAPR